MSAAGAVDDEKVRAGESIRSKIFAIVTEVNEFIDEEVHILNESLTQIQGLAKGAVTGLSGSMRSLNHQVHMQSKMLHKLAGITADRETDADSESMNLGQYVEDSQSVIQYFIDLLDSVQETRGHYLDGLDKARDKVKETNQLLESGASNAEARIVLSRVKTLLDRQRSLVERSRLFDQSHKSADEAISRMTSTREKLQEMRDVVSMNVEAFSTQSNKDVDEAVRSLQFEDIVTQLVADAQFRLDEMNLLVKALNSRTDHLKLVDTAEEPVGALEVVHEIQEDAQTRIDKLRGLRSKPVDQSSMDEGSVELF
jgi:methyl-accepting chemotaxis protein